ncbi:unnamed protein product [Moneuplotes crassus]|uniref:Uncharacterized protein n=1 Tax=Euplotes crassus TaxID=5936 RepID=A0AAD1U6F5_EUPCR|nr:unnamed protein product [Moneuplotes crassus]
MNLEKLSHLNKKKYQKILEMGKKRAEMIEEKKRIKEKKDMEQLAMRANKERQQDITKRFVNQNEDLKEELLKMQRNPENYLIPKNHRPMVEELSSLDQEREARKIEEKIIEQKKKETILMSNHQSFHQRSKCWYNTNSMTKNKNGNSCISRSRNITKMNKKNIKEKDKTQLDLFQKMAREGNKRLKIKMKHLKSQNAIYLNPENLNSMSRNSMSLTNNAQSKTQPLNPTSLPTFTQSQLLDPNLSLPVTQTPTENTKNYIQYNSFFAKYKNAGHITKLDSNLKSRSANFQPSPERGLKDQDISRSRNFGVGSKDQGVLENRGFEGNFKKKEIRKPPLGKLVSTKPKIVEDKASLARIKTLIKNCKLSIYYNEEMNPNEYMGRGYPNYHDPDLHAERERIAVTPVQPDTRNNELTFMESIKEDKGPGKLLKPWSEIQKENEKKLAQSQGGLIFAKGTIFPQKLDNSRSRSVSPNPTDSNFTSFYSNSKHLYSPFYS